MSPLWSYTTRAAQQHKTYLPFRAAFSLGSEVRTEDANDKDVYEPVNSLVGYEVAMGYERIAWVYNADQQKTTHRLWIRLCSLAVPVVEGVTSACVLLLQPLQSLTIDLKPRRQLVTVEHAVDTATGSFDRLGRPAACCQRSNVRYNTSSYRVIVCVYWRS